MLIAEDLVLLVTDDETGKRSVTGTAYDAALGGALLMELALRGRVDVEGEGRGSRVVVRDGSPTGEPVLDDALARLSADGPVSPKKAVTGLAKKASERVHDSLVRRGILRREEGRVLGIFPVTRWPAEHSAQEAALRTQLHSVLVLGVQPTPEIAATVSLLRAANLLSSVVDRADRKVAKQRAKEIESLGWASDGVRRVVEAADAAVLAAVMAATAATTAATTASS